ncbi:MAG: hypothetical protein ACTH31_05235 [Pseudoclavibacter sp.]
MSTASNGDDPFDEVDGSPLNVSPGVFNAEGPDEIVDRTGATSVRWQRGGAWNKFQSHSVTQRRGLLVAISLVVLMALVIPLTVGFFANWRRESLAAQQAEQSLPSVVALTPEVQAIQEQLDPLQAAFVMSNGIAADDVKGEMDTRITDTNDAILANDAGGAQSQVDDAKTYFTETYSQTLPDRATAILEAYPYSEWETDERIEEVGNTIRSLAGGQDFDALVAAVIELPQLVGNAMSEHLGNRVTYVPPSDNTNEPEPTPTGPATVGPPPSQTGTPGDGNNGNDDSSGNGGDDDGDNFGGGGNDANGGGGNGGDANGGGGNGNDADSNGGGGNGGGQEADAEADPGFTSGTGGGFGG